MSLMSNGDSAPDRGSIASDAVSSRNDLVVGIPTYNEEVAIGSIVLQASRYADEVVVVDDGSSDATVEIASEAGATVIEHDENRGKGRAIQTLLAYVQDGDLDALVLLDGDGQHTPHDIPAVAEPVTEGECDIAIGSRYIEQERDETPLYRRFGQQVLDLLVLGSSGANLTDTQSGFRAVSPDAASALNIRTDGMGVESEMIDTASERGLEIEEVPIDVRYEDVDGQTYNPVRHGLSVVAFVLQLIRDRNPLLFFGLAGVVGLAAGGTVALHGLFAAPSGGAIGRWRLLGGGFFALLGTLSLFCGLLLSQIRRIVIESDE